MKTKHFFAGCKTRYLTLLTVLTLLCAFSVGNAWGETITLTQSVLNITATAYASSSGSKTVGNVDFSWDKIIKSSSNMQLQASNGVIWNTSLVPGKITNVSITHSGTARASTLYWGTSAKATTNSTSISGTSSSNSPANSCFGYVYVKRGTSAAYWTEMVITYTPATITLSKNSITGLNYNVGSGPSASQTFTVSGSNIPANLVVTAPTNFEVSLNGSSWASSQTINVTLTGSASAGTLSSTTVYVRLASGKSAGSYNGNVEIAMDGCNTISGVNPKTVAVSGTVSAAATPTLTVSTSSITSGLTYVSGSGPSAAQTFTVSGSDLTANVTVSAPTNFEVSTSSGSGYGSSVTLTRSGTSVSTTTIYVRLKSGLAVNSYSGNITVSSTGATNKTVSLSGSVTAPVTYSVTYNGNDNTSGSVPTDATAYSSGATVTVLDNTGSLTKTGYTFAGWNTQANGNGTTYSAGGTFTISANTTLFAKWDINKYTVTWSVNGNTSTISATTNVEYGTTTTAPNATPSGDCAGLTFVGWTTSTNSSYSNATTPPTPLFTGTTPNITDNVTFYAVFAEED